MITDEIGQHLPKYLSPEKQAELVSALRDFENRPYYTRQWPDQILQGDGWTSFTVLRFPDGKSDRIKGIVLSNSCDIDPDNPRPLPVMMTFAPLVSVSNYVGVLKRAGFSDEKIGAKIQSIRKQSVTSIFFVPKGDQLDQDYIALLDGATSMPFEHFRKTEAREKLFTLSQMGFYLFVLKLSIHFCRFQEGLTRDS